MKTNKISIALWCFCILIYIANIVIVCITGPSLINNIMAWCCSIMLVVDILVLNKRNEHLYKTIDNDLIWLTKILKFLSEAKQESEDQTEPKTTNASEVKDERR